MNQSNNMIKEIQEQLEKEYAEDFTDNPSESKAQMFEEAGFAPDYKDQDQGDEPKKYPRFEGKYMSDEELATYL